MSAVNLLLNAIHSNFSEAANTRHVILFVQGSAVPSGGLVAHVAGQLFDHLAGHPSQWKSVHSQSRRYWTSSAWKDFLQLKPRIPGLPSSRNPHLVNHTFYFYLPDVDFSQHVDDQLV